MQQYLEILQTCRLFAEIPPDSLKTMLECFAPTIQTYAKQQTLLYAGEPLHQLGIVLTGKVQLVRLDYDGNRSITASLSPAQPFGEAFVCAGVDAAPISVIAATESTILWLEGEKLLHPCCNACGFHQQLLFNVIQLLARKNVLFHQKLEITAKRTTREKLLAYLFQQAKQENSNTFVIPYDRQGLADYLEVDRSGLSAEISKLRKEGILETKKNWFCLHL